MKLNYFVPTPKIVWYAKEQQKKYDWVNIFFWLQNKLVARNLYIGKPRLCTLSYYILVVVYVITHLFCVTIKCFTYIHKCIKPLSHLMKSDDKADDGAGIPL